MNNTPAFPLEFQNNSPASEHHYGLTKLEYASIEAMKAIIIGNDADVCVSSKSGAVGMSKDAIICAKELLKQLEGETK